MDPGLAHGLFVRDSRVISLWRLTIDGHPPEALRGFTEEPFAGVFVGRGRARPGSIEPTLLVERRRYVGTGMREDLVLHNQGAEPAGLAVTVEVGADFADLFAVKVGRGRPPAPVAVDGSGGDTWRARMEHSGRTREVRVRAPDGSVTATGVSFRVVVPAHGTWRTALQVEVNIDGVDLPTRFPIDQPLEGALPARRMAEWRQASPRVQCDSAVLSATLARSDTDLAALRIADPGQPDIAVVAAGAPWFMALFGRDSLIVSWMMLPVSMDLAIGTLSTLARYQGTRVDPLTEEQPGRILHELRFGTDPSLALGGSDGYYGSADSTPLFVMVLGELARWGADHDVLRALLPAADRALRWIDEYGDRDGDGFVEYLRSTDRGLRNQGWKDSSDGINFADGTLAEPPIALAEVQGYVYAAYRARAALAAVLGDPDGAVPWRERAARLKARFNEAFWLPERGYFAVGLDGDKRPIDALASNMGHCLWTGIVDADKSGLAAAHLASPQLFSGYGVRTLATSMGAYNPASYHNGSVWPHDTALCVAGLVRYGHVREAHRIAAGLVDAAAFFAGRLPEVFCGFDRDRLPGPVPYPTSCSPQAWASAAPFSLVTSMLRFVPDLPSGRVAVSPSLPRRWGALRISDVRVGANRMSIEVDRDGEWMVRGADGLEVVDAGTTDPSG
jgi:glycogen debranching enzyme